MKAETTRRPLFPAWARAFLMKWTRGLLKNQSSAELCGSHQQADSKNFSLPEGMSG